MHTASGCASFVRDGRLHRFGALLSQRFENGISPQGVRSCPAAPPSGRILPWPVQFSPPEELIRWPIIKPEEQRRLRARFRLRYKLTCLAIIQRRELTRQLHVLFELRDIVTT